jgi:hypothetical protein
MNQIEYRRERRRAYNSIATCSPAQLALTSAADALRRVLSA